MNANYHVSDDQIRAIYERRARRADPDGLHASIVAATAGVPQRHAGLRRLRDARTALGTLGALRAIDRRAALRLVLVALLVAAAAAVAVGALRRQDPAPPLGRNGAIVVSIQGNDHSGNVTYQLAADGTDPTETTATSCRVYSRDGTTFGTQSGGELGTFVEVYPADGSVSRLLPIEPDYFGLSRPGFDISPDGSRVVWLKAIARDQSEDGTSTWVSQHEIWITAVVGGESSLIVPAAQDPIERYDIPVWSPDGRFIAFGSWARNVTTDSWYRSAIYVVGADGSNLRRLTQRPATMEGQVAWSAEGRFLAYVGLPDGASLPSTSANPPATDARHDVFVIGADATGDQNITRSRGFERSPAWAPDGTAIAFGRAADGEAYELAVVRMIGAVPVLPPTRGPAADDFIWSPDASALLLTRTADDAATVRIVGRDLEPLAPAAAQFDGSINCRPAWLPLDR